MAKLYSLASQISIIFIISIIFSDFVYAVVAKSEDEASECTSNVLGPCHNKARAQRLNYIAIVAILVASMVGVSLPLFSRTVPAFRPEKDMFLIIRAFASGVIVATGFMHVMPDSWNDLTSPCLPDKPWRAFPFTPFITMLSAYGTMMMDSFSIAYYERNARSNRDVNVNGNDNGNRSNVRDIDNKVELGLGEENNGHVGHHHGHIMRVTGDKESSQLLKDRVVAQVLELGIVVHSVVIGLSMGASDNPCTIEPLIAAICFHQLFEGMGLGGCILQAEYKFKVKAIMVFFFSVTTPLGIVLGILLQHVYKENSPTALIVVGTLNAVSAGLLIYMALVDLLSADFKGPRLQKNLKLQGCCYVVALLGTGLMSLMAKWA